MVFCFSAVCSSVLLFALILSKSMFLSLVDAHASENLSQTVSVCLSDSPTGGRSSVNESLCFQTRCLVSYDKSAGAQPLPLQLWC